MSLHTFDRGSWGRADIPVDFVGVGSGVDEIRSVLIRHMILRGNGRDELGSVLIWHMILRGGGNGGMSSDRC